MSFADAKRLTLAKFSSTRRIFASVLQMNAQYRLLTFQPPSPQAPAQTVPTTSIKGKLRRASMRRRRIQGIGCGRRPSASGSGLPSVGACWCQGSRCVAAGAHGFDLRSICSGGPLCLLLSDRPSVADGGREGGIQEKGNNNGPETCSPDMVLGLAHQRRPRLRHRRLNISTGRVLLVQGGSSSGALFSIVACSQL